MTVPTQCISHQKSRATMNHDLRNVKKRKFSVFALSSSSLFASSASFHKTDKDNILQASHRQSGYDNALFVNKAASAISRSWFEVSYVHAAEAIQHRKLTLKGCSTRFRHNTEPRSKPRVVKRVQRLKIILSRQHPTCQRIE